ILGWPHRRETWNFAESLGEEVSLAFWQSKVAWAMEANREDLDYAIGKYLSVDRAEVIVDALAPKLKDVSTQQILSILDQFEERIAKNATILKNQTIAFDIQQIFAELQTRKDVALTAVASREYKFLPLLRDTYGTRSQHSLAIDQFMSESPEFFVQ